MNSSRGKPPWGRRRIEPNLAKDIAPAIHNLANKKRTSAFHSHPSRATPVSVGGFLTKAQSLPAPPASPDPARIRFLHIRCLRPGCGHDAVIDAVRRFAGRALPAEGLSARFLCECGARTAHVSHEMRKPKRDNGCGWL